MKARLFLLAVSLLAALPAAAQEFPNRAITMIVAFPPGGVADITARPTAAAMEKILKQPVAVTTCVGGTPWCAPTRSRSGA